MIFATERALCISVVRPDLFQVTAFEHGVLPASLMPLSPLSLISGIPSLVALIVLCSSHAQRFLQGLALGGAWGVREGATRPLAVSNTRLRINSVLNSVTRRGTFIGNSAGVLGPSTCFWYDRLRFLTSPGFLALVYNGVNSSIDAVRGKHDILGSMGAGGITGALYKSTGANSPSFHFFSVALIFSRYQLV